MSACIAVAKIDDAGASRDSARRRSDRLLQSLAQTMAGDDAEPVTIRHVSGSAPAVFRGERVCTLKASMAHSGPWVAVGLATTGNIGVDIEVESDRKRFRGIAEFLGLDADALLGEQQFFSSWVLREAVAKAMNESVLTANSLEPELAAACREHGRVVNAGCLTALVGVLAPHAHLAVVLNSNPEVPTCAWR